MMAYKRGFIPYALAALLIGLVGGFSTVLGPAFVQNIGIAYFCGGDVACIHNINRNNW